MTNATASKQLIITVNNKVGTLAEVTSVLSSVGINLIAVCAYAVDNKGVIIFVTEDNNQAKKLLKDKKYDVREEEVVLISIDNKPGELQKLTEKIAKAKIDLTLLYGSVDQKGKTSRIILVSENNKAAITALQMAS